ncbi:hypothetical protein CIK05_13390 [Bdellovibrio sp. qaytius]|nr:hypothetical protein CIK05_13390 [Bdellovibrio sp. qaytius]
MKTSNKQMGWGTLGLLIMVVMISACAEKKSTAHATDSDAVIGQEFDYFTQECNSGERSSIVRGEVVKQTDADATRSVLLIWEDAKGEQHLCSSSLIDNQTLLTAAHCVNEAIKMEAIFYTDVTCGSGYKRSEHAITVDKMTFHPDYKGVVAGQTPFDDNQDLGLVHLSRPAPANFPIYKISKTPEALVDSDLYIYGYGITGTFNHDSMLLRKATVKRRTSDITKKDITYFIGKNLLWDQSEGSGLCSGDSGGAVLMDDKGELVIASVNSEVFMSAEDKSEDLCNYGAKTVVVYHYLDSWIIPTMAAWGQTVK